MVKNLKQIIDLMGGFTVEHGFKPVENEIGHFKNETKDFLIEFNAGKRVFTLKIADIKDGETDDYTVASTWLYDDNHRDDDIKTIAKDFEEVLFKNMGLVRKKVNGIEEVQMPEKTITGQTPNIMGFTQKFLAYFPQYRDEYKQNVATYGEFLYLEFYKKAGVEKLAELSADVKNNKKALTKYINLLGDMFEDGDSNVGAVITSVIIAGAFIGKIAEYEALKEMFDNHKELYNAGRHSIMLATSNKKVRSLFN